VQAYHEFGADRVIAEENFGGEMVRFVIRAADANLPVHMVSASRGKVLRAEPVSALYEQGLVHHVGRFAVLEDQHCAFTTAGYRGEGSPDHADALVFAITELMLKDSAPMIIEFYRRQVEERQHAAANAPATAAPAPPATIRLRVPEGISTVHGLSTTSYMVGADRVIAVAPEDVEPLLSAGYVRLAEETSEAAGPMTGVAEQSSFPP
jgi:hypothetical protein